MNAFQKLYLWATSKPNTASFVFGVVVTLIVEHLVLK